MQSGDKSIDSFYDNIDGVCSAILLESPKMLYMTDIDKFKRFIRTKAE
jgi:hypothetical protein